MAEQDLLIADAEREEALARLREACVDGRLTLAEFSERLDAVFAARIRADLLPAIADLSAAPQARPRPATDRVVAVMGPSKRRARWRVADRLTAVAVMGECELDLRSAEVEGIEVEIEAVAVMGTVRIIVPPGVEVDLGGWAALGSKEHKDGPDLKEDLKESLRSLFAGRTEHPPRAPFQTRAAALPRIRVEARVVMGSVEVVHRAERRGDLPGLPSLPVPPGPPLPPLPPRP